MLFPLPVPWFFILICLILVWIHFQQEMHQVLITLSTFFTEKTRLFIFILCHYDWFTLRCNINVWNPIVITKFKLRSFIGHKYAISHFTKMCFFMLVYLRYASLCLSNTSCINSSHIDRWKWPKKNLYGIL